ncbi:hypothetical protein B0H14DRAFT_3136076, partial [Mycena olivaceomarginata]
LEVSLDNVYRTSAESRNLAASLDDGSPSLSVRRRSCWLEVWFRVGHHNGGLERDSTKEPPFSEAISVAEEHTTFPSPDIHKGKWHGRLRKQKEPPRDSRPIAKTYGEALKRRRKRVKCKEGDEA